MFDDLITKKNFDAKPSGPKDEDEERVRQYTLNLLMDVEDVLTELNLEIMSIIGGCHFCGKTEGAPHKEKCQYRLASMRLAMEIDYYQ